MFSTDLSKPPCLRWLCLGISPGYREMFSLGHKTSYFLGQEGSAGLYWHWTMIATNSVLTSEKRGPVPFSSLLAHVRGEQKALISYFLASHPKQHSSPRKARKPRPTLVFKAWSVHVLTCDIKVWRAPRNSPRSVTGLGSISETAPITLFPCCPKSLPFHHLLERC